jgi:Toprim domain
MISFQTLAALRGTKIVSDAACPLCGPSCKSGINQKRKVLRIWSNDGDFIRFKCARCEASGYAKRDGMGFTKPVDRAPADPASDKRDLAAYLWSESSSLQGTLADIYLRSRFCRDQNGVSASLRFLPARKDHQPAMIARFDSGTNEITGIHLTKLAKDGKGKAGTEKDKIMIGPSRGQPIVVHENDEGCDLVITEGIEDALSIAFMTGWTAWAAGSAGRIAHIVPLARRFERVFIAVDNDYAGAKALINCRGLRPDAIPLNFSKIFNIKQRLDANAVLIEYGGDAIMAAIRWAEAQAEFLCGSISFDAMQVILNQTINPFVEVEL